MLRIQQGDVYCLFSDDVGKPRPVVVVSREELNGGDSVVVIPFTSKQLEKRKQLAYCAFFAAGAFGQHVDCVAKTDLITLMDKSEINFAGGKIGTLTATQMRKVFQALDCVLAR